MTIGYAFIVRKLIFQTLRFVLSGNSAVTSNNSLGISILIVNASAIIPLIFSSARNIKTRQGKKWDTAHVNRILSNHTYVGEIKYKDAICKGEQETIVPRDLWGRIKEIQRSIDPQSDHSRRQETIAPLKSILRCGHCGRAMMPTYSNKSGRRYYYYLCSKDSKRAISECPVKVGK